MKRIQLKGKDLRKLGFKQGPAIGQLISYVRSKYRIEDFEQMQADLKALAADPESHLDKPELESIVRSILGKAYFLPKERELREKALDFECYGEEAIQHSAKEQMRTAMSLPVAKAGALMPDAHHGYGLPIGGVLATENAIIPYAVGVDIDCRMALSVFPTPLQKLKGEKDKFRNILLDNTRFGRDIFRGEKLEDAVLDREEFKTIPEAKRLQEKAWKQLGSSGGGNHFVEFGEVEISEGSELKLEPGKYLGLLSHSGSRGFGAGIAAHYTRLAKELCPLPKQAQHLAWLDMDTEAGMEYWLAMNLAGDYASACHHQIHQKVARALGEKALARVENHHNFAWKQEIDGKELIVHRKGATPAEAGELGIIPGSMTAPGFIIRGRGNLSSLKSASHGAGRQLSRTAAKQQITQSELKQVLKDQGVTLIGGCLDEAPMAYKNIQEVMAAQSELVDILGIFKPRLVRMAGPSYK